QAVVVEVEDVDAVQLFLPDPRREHQHRGIAGLDLVEVAEILEDLDHVAEDDAQRLDPFIRLEDGGAAEDDVGREQLGPGGEVLRLGGAAERIALHRGRPYSLPSHSTGPALSTWAPSGRPSVS